MIKITKIIVQGFRSFSERQEIDLDSSLCLFYGENSHGKTSLGEAIEFLLCGKTARRDLVAVTKKEFANSLRNASFSGEVYVEAWIKHEIKDGTIQEKHIRRKLINDYPTNNDDCISSLELEAEGKWSDFSFESIGLPTWNSPDSLPIIFQHTLRYVSSAKPSDRLRYFRKLLDIEDIVQARDTIKQVADHYSTEPTDEQQKQLVQLAKELKEKDSFNDLEKLFQDPPPNRENRRQTLINVMRSLLSANYEKAALAKMTDDEIISKFSSALAESREQTAKIPSLELPTLPGDWLKPSEAQQTIETTIKDITTAKQDYDKDNAVIEKSTTLVFPLLSEALKIPEYQTLFEGSKECNLCLANTLTWQRLETIRETLKKPGIIKQARNELNEALAEFKKTMSDFHQNVLNQIPQQLKNIDLKTVETLAGTEQAMFGIWQEAFLDLVKKQKVLLALINNITLQLNSTQTAANNGKEFSICPVDNLIAELKRLTTSFETTRSDYINATNDLSPIINKEIDSRSGREDWTALLKLWNNRTPLQTGLIENLAKLRIKKELDDAVTKITAANAAVLKEDKYPDISKDIEHWWGVFRPDEPVSFKEVQPKGQGLAEIDLKATLLQDDTSLIERNAIGIFSDSQLNCLGLSIFLARTIKEKNGFIIFDDPIQSLDREHADFLTMKVVDALLNKHGMQVMILTHDLEFWRDLKTLYATTPPKGISVKKIKQGGTTLVDRDSDLNDLFQTIESIHRVPDEGVFNLSANRIRTAAEVLCKNIICKYSPVLQSNLNGKMLPELIQLATPYLTLSPSHSSTLSFINRRTNAGSHDAVRYAPGSTALREMFGNLKKFKKDYLDTNLQINAKTHSLKGIRTKLQIIL